MSFEKNNNNPEALELQDRNKTDFEKDFGDKKKEIGEIFDSPAMEVIAQNYDTQSPAQTVDNVIKAVAGKELVSLNADEQAKFDEIKAEFVAELALDENGKISAESLGEMAENIHDLTDFVSGLVGGKGKQYNGQLEEMEAEVKKGQEANKKFVEAMQKFLQEVQARKQLELQKSAQAAKDANTEGNKEKLTSEKLAEKSLEKWPPETA